MSAVTGNETDAEKISRLQGKVFELEKALTASEANCNRIINQVTNGEAISVTSDNTQLLIQISNLEAELTNAQRTVKGYTSECREVEQTLGQAMGYPWYRDDSKNFPDATDADGVCVGEHTPASIAMEAAQRILKLEKELKELKDNAIPQSVVDDLQTRLDEAREDQIGYYDLDYPPRAVQGAPTNESGDLLTADDVNFMIRRVDDLTGWNRDLQAERDILQVELTTAQKQCEQLMSAVKNNNTSINYTITQQAGQISRLEACLRWALRKFVPNANITTRDITRASEIWTHVFPSTLTSGTTRRRRNDDEYVNYR